MISREDILNCSEVDKKFFLKDIPYSISTDSRKFKGNNLFISLYGDNFDSINFVSDVFKEGCELVILENRPQNLEKIGSLKEEYGAERFIVVKNIFDFILELGRIRSLRFQKQGGIVIGLTGSNGKTTNKEMLRHLLSFMPENEVWATRGNLNNQIGVPLTLFDLKEEHRVAVVEMGTSFPGEIEVLAKCSLPQYGFITNIGYAHIEFLGSLEGVFKEKSALLEEIVNHDKGLFLINGFDAYLLKHKDRNNTELLCADNFKIQNNSFSIQLGTTGFEVRNPNLRGDHQKINMGMCLMLLSYIYPQKINQIVEKANNYSPPGMNRGEVVVINNSEVYLDAYNANPSSMEASLKSYTEFLKDRYQNIGNSFIVLGDMNELGKDAPELHAKIGKLLKNLSPGQAYFVGRYAQDYAKGYGEQAICFESTAEIKSHFKDNGLPFSQGFIKGSRSLQLESIIDITAG